MNKTTHIQALNPVDDTSLAEAFAVRLQDGNYRQLFASHLESIFNQATEHLAESGLSEEIGSLRVVLARLMANESELEKNAPTVARVVSVSIRAIQAQSTLTGHSTSKVIEAISKVLEDLEDDTLSDETES